MGWETLGESVIGSSHRTRGVPCQDAFRYGVFGERGEWLAVAVADGAGSASCSERGAMLACDVILRGVAGGVERLLSLDGIRQQVDVVRSALRDEAAAAGIRVRELACTLLIAVVGPDRAAFAQVGDGAIVVRSIDGEHDIVFWPEPSEYVNATSFVTDDTFESSLQFKVIEGPIQEIAVLTDGLQRLALDFDRRAPHVAFFAPMFATIRGSSDRESLLAPFRDFLDSKQVNERTDDDKTLVISVRCDE